LIPQPIEIVPLFQRLSEEERQLVTARLKRRQVAPGELILSAGHPGDTLFIVTAGWVKLEGVDPTVTLANLGAGSLLGEADMLLGRPYSITARAAGSTDTQLLTLTRSDLEDLVNAHPSIGLKFSASIGVRIAFLEEYLTQQRLRHIELLSALAEADLRALAQRLDFRAYARGDVIAEAGAPCDAAFFIEAGSVRWITKTTEGESFEDLKEGAVFGHTALLTGKPSPATARAITDVTLWVLPRAVYQDLIRTQPAIKLALSRALAESLNQRDQADAAERMRQLRLFADAPTDALSALAARLVLRHFPAEETIYTDGTPGDAMYIVEAGQVQLRDSLSATARLLERARAGDAFGEMALLTGRTRAECARAATDATVWVLYKSDFDDVMVQYPAISISLSRALTERLTARESDLIIRHLRRIGLFSNLAASELKEISKRVRGLRFRPGEIVCFAGEPAQTLFLIEKGQVKRMVAGSMGEPVMLDILDAGDSFGEQDIVQNTAYGATAQAMSETELWTISKADFLALMEEYPTLAITVTRLMADRLNRVQHAPPVPPRYPRGGASASPRPPANMPPPAPRIQRPPSGARPLRPPTPVAPQKPSAPKPTQMRATAPAPATRPAPARPQARTVAKPALQTRTAKPAVASIQPRAPRRQNLFFKEFGAWASGLSLGAKLRVLTLGMLAVWFTLVALPWATITTVSSAVGGLQLSNAPVENGAVTADRPAQAVRAPSSGNAPKVAFAVATNTPVPTRTPQPTFTPRPKPTLAPVTRTPAPPPASAAVAPPTATVPPLPPVDMDPRLGSGPKVLPLLDKVQIIPASVGHGQKFWRAIRVKFENVEESGNDHSIYVKIFDAAGKRTEAKLKLWGEGVGDIPDPEQKSAQDMCDCNYGIGMYGDAYAVQIVDQYPSDKVVGMIMPMRRHVNYRIAFQLVTNP